MSDAADGDHRRLSGRAWAEHPWRIQPQRSAETALLHRGGCGPYKSGALFGREAAISAPQLREGHAATEHPNPPR
ncbi:hypothetical protein AB0C61_20360 [Streptomyces sp. NPDC048680]|uniref:hypothetical protein n=1 Tax=Streptomyces sp. NPDC048680 TaxID=3155492 RepID=UPI0034130149